MQRLLFFAPYLFSTFSLPFLPPLLSSSLLFSSLVFSCLLFSSLLLSSLLFSSPRLFQSNICAEPYHLHFSFTTRFILFDFNLLLILPRYLSIRWFSFSSFLLSSFLSISSVFSIISDFSVSSVFSVFSIVSIFSIFSVFSIFLHYSIF